jgi:hypothetical protein
MCNVMILTFVWFQYCCQGACCDCGCESVETCNCCCLEIRLRDKHPAPPPPATSNKPPWVTGPDPNFRSLASLPESSAGRDQGNGWVPMATYPVTKHPVYAAGGRWVESGGDFVQTSMPHLQTHGPPEQLFIRPGVYSAGRVVAKRIPGPWPSNNPPRRWSSRRRSSRRVRSPSIPNTSPVGRRRSSGRSASGSGRNRSHRPGSPLAKSKTPTSSQELDHPHAQNQQSET